MALDRSRYKIEPMDLANMRQNGSGRCWSWVSAVGTRCSSTSISIPAIFLFASSGRAWCAPSAAWSAPTSGRTGKSGTSEAPEALSGCNRV
jgi:hypothetical protein